MKKLACTVLLLLLVPLNSYAMNILKEHFQVFQDVVRIQGYICDSCEGGHYLGSGYRGGVFRVYCNENTLRYRVVWEGQYLCVEPWDREPALCE